MLPKNYAASLAALTVIAVGCSTTGFRGIPKAPEPVPSPMPAPQEVEKNRTPVPTVIPVVTPLPTPLPTLPPVPHKVLEMQISQLQPEAWWNNCLTIVVGDQTVDMGCTKDTGALKTVHFVLPEDTTCVNLGVQVRTYKNMGSTCSDRAKTGLSCEGPYPSVPNLVRSPSVSAQMKFFKVENTGALQQSLRISFEDQDASAIDDAASNPARAEELGIDFNDLQFEVRAGDLKLGVAGSPVVCAP